MTFEEWLNDEIENSEDEAKSSHKAAMNSYGAGYDRGYLEALQVVSRKMSPELARCSISDDD